MANNNLNDILNKDLKERDELNKFSIINDTNISIDHNNSIFQNIGNQNTNRSRLDADNLNMSSLLNVNQELREVSINNRSSLNRK